MTEDGALFVAWHGGDRAAGRELAHRYFAPMMRFFVNKAPTHAEDLVQRTFLRCLEAFSRYEERGRFRAFLYGTARIVLLEHARSERRAARAGEDPDEHETSLAVYGSPSRVMGERREHQLLLEALRRIPLELQVLTELYYWEDLPVGELAVVLELPVGTIKSRLSRARRLVQEQLQQLDASGDLAERSVQDLDAWAAKVRAQVGEAAASTGRDGDER